MSKGNLFFGNARGKLGETVFYRAGGEQRNRTYIKKIKNPKTIAQMTQRILTLNPISLFKNMKPVISESFTERKANQSSYNKFVQENSSAKKFFITKAMLEQNLCVPYGATIAKGSLGVNLEPRIEMITDNDMTTGYAVFDCLFDAKKITDFSGLTSSGANSLSGETLVRVLRESSVVTLPNDFTVVFVEGVKQDFELESGDIVEPWKMAYKVIRVSGNTYTEEIYGCPEAYLEGSLYFLPQDMGSRPSADNLGAHIGFNLMGQTAEEVIFSPMGVVLSFVENGELKVSNSTIMSNYKNVGVTPVRGVVNAFLEGNAVYREAMNQYGFSTGGTLNAAKLASGTCYIEFTGDYEDLLVNGVAAASGEFKVGTTLLFSNNTTESIGIDIDGEMIAPDIAMNRTASWVVPEAAELTLHCEQEMP